MPTEDRAGVQKSLQKLHEQTTSSRPMLRHVNSGDSAAGNDHRDSNGIRAPRRKHLKAPRSAAKLEYTAPDAGTDVLDSNSDHSKRSRVSKSSRSPTRSFRTAPYAVLAENLDSIPDTQLPAIRKSSSAKSSSSNSSPNQEESQQRARDILLLRKELMKQSIGLPNNEQLRASRKGASDPFLENGTGSWVNSLREPPAGRRNTVSRKPSQQKEIMSESGQSSISEGEDKPARRNMNGMPASRTHKYANITASQARDLPTKPSNADRQPPEGTEYGDIPAVQKNIYRSSNSASKSVVKPLTPQNTESQTGSVTVQSAGARRRGSLDTHNSLSRPELHRSSSARLARTKAGSSDSSNVDSNLEGAGPYNSKAASIRAEIRDEKTADATRTHRRHANSGGKLEGEDEIPVDSHKTHRRDSGTDGNLRREHDIAPNSAGRGLSNSSRHEGDAHSVRPVDSHRTHRRDSGTDGNSRREHDMAHSFGGRGSSHSFRHEGEAHSVRPVDSHKTRRRDSGTDGNSRREPDMAHNFGGRGSSHSSRHEGDAHSARPVDSHRFHRRDSGTDGTLRREPDIAPNSEGRGLTRSFRHEGEAQAVAGALRRSNSKNIDDLKREYDTAPYSAGTGLSHSVRHEGEAHSVAGALRRSNSKNIDDLKREYDTAPYSAGTGLSHSVRHEGEAHSVAGVLRRSSSSRNNDDLKREHDIAPKLAGRGLSQSFRHIREAHSEAGALRRSSSSRKNDNLKQEAEDKIGPANSQRMRRHISNGENLEREHGTAADVPTRRLTHERESDYATGSRRRSSSRNRSYREEHAAHVSFAREGAGRNFEESAADYRNMHGRQHPTEGNLTQENVSNSAAGSKVAPRRSTKPDAFRSAFSPVQKHPATNDNVGMRLTKVAAASYSGGWLPFGEMVPFPDDIAGLNKFLDGCRKEVEEGMEGRYVTVVLGRENSDLDSMVSTIAYAYYLHCKITQESQHILPVINMRQENFVQKPEAAWLFKVSGVDTSHFIFVDQISLPHCKKFGSLSLVLVDHSKLAPHQEQDLQDTVVTIIDHNLPESVYPSVLNLEIEEVGSCCTIIAEKYAAEVCEKLAGRGISRLLLGPILLDTTNLDGTFAICTTRDECMAALLINGAGCYGRQGFFRYLRNMRFDISHLSTKDALKKEFMGWKLGHGKASRISAGMSSLGVPLFAILSRKDVITDFRQFGETMDLDFHLIVTGYFDNFDRYHREILVVVEDNELAQHITKCFSEHDDDLRLSPFRIDGLAEHMLVYKQRQVTASRKIIRKILSLYFAR